MRRSTAGADERRLPRFAGPRSLLAVVAIVALTASAGTAFAGEAKKDTKKAPNASPVAHAIVPEVAVFETPDAPEPKLILQNPTATGGELVLLVDALKSNGWINVVLPVRPNGSTGWVRTADVTIQVNPYRIVIDLSDHKLVTFKAKKRILDVAAGIGKGNTPTPGGRYYITQLFQPPDPGGAYGPYAYSLSGYSEVLTTFQGGDAIIGIHGTNKPELVGQDVSAGCIRITNDDIKKLARKLPLGTPVQIRA